MAKYINRDTFLERQRAWYCKDCGMRKNTRGKFVYEIGGAACKACDIGTMLDAVEDYPAADVVERKTGKWMEYLYPGHEHVYCSECKTQWFHDDLYLGGNDFPKFCPECGVSMDNWETVAGGE